MKMKVQHKLLLVIDDKGRVIATAPADEPEKGDGPRVTLGVLPGQTVHEVPLLKELEPHLSKSAEDLHRALADYHVSPGRSRSLLVPNQDSRTGRK